MTIELFHSYNYVYGKFKKKNKDVYDDKNNLLFSLVNIPNESELYKINIQRILNKKVYSRKKNDKYYYTKHNIKVFLVINYNILNKFIKNNTDIPEIDILTKIINNNTKINQDKYLKNIICFNKSSSKQIKYRNNLVINSNYFYLKDFYLDLKNKLIVSKNKIINNEYLVKGCIIFYDILFKLVQEFNKKTTLFIINKNEKQIFINLNLSFKVELNNSDKNVKWENIVIFNNNYNKINLNNIEYNSLFVCINKPENIKINDILNIYEKFYNINFSNFITNTKLINSLLKCIVLKIYEPKSIRKINIKLKSDISNKNDNNTHCCICYSNINDIQTKCNHSFCSECIEKITKHNKFSCPMCRQINSITTNKIIYDSKINYFKNKNNIQIISNSLKKIEYYKTNNINVSLIDNLDTNKSNKIYFLENIESYDYNLILSKISTDNKMYLYFFTK